MTRGCPSRSVSTVGSGYWRMYWRALAGGGLFQIYHFVAAEALRQGKLVEVMAPFAGRSRPFYALYPQHRHLSARVRAFVDYLLAAVRP